MELVDEKERDPDLVDELEKALEEGELIYDYEAQEDAKLEKVVDMWAQIMVDYYEGQEKLKQKAADEKSQKEKNLKNAAIRSQIQKLNTQLSQLRSRFSRDFEALYDSYVPKKTEELHQKRLAKLSAAIRNGDFSARGEYAGVKGFGPSIANLKEAHQLFKSYAPRVALCQKYEREKSRIERQIQDLERQLR